MSRKARRDKGDIVKYVTVRDSDILYRQFVSGAGDQLSEKLERAYDELKICRIEAQGAFYHYVISFAVLTSVLFGVVDSFEALGATINKNSILYVSLLAGGLLSLRYGYVQSRVSFLRAIFEAHSRRLSPAKLAAWIAIHPLAYLSFNLYSTLFRWPPYLIPENRRMSFELVNVILLGLGAVVAILINLAIIVSAYLKVLRESNYSWLAIAVVVSSTMMYVGSSFFPKFGSTKRRYQHVGLLGLLKRLDGQPDRKHRAYERIARAQDNLGGNPTDLR